MRPTINWSLVAVVIALLLSRGPQSPSEITPAGDVTPSVAVPSPGRDAVPDAPAGDSQQVAEVGEPKRMDVTPEASETAAAVVPCKVLFFTATWCVPCRVAKPQAKEACVTCDAEFIESDVDKYAAYAKRWSVDVCPTIVVTVERDGRSVERWRWEGALEAPQLARAIDAARRPSGWEIDELRTEIDDHTRRFSKRERWGIENMTPLYHLTHDHGWPEATAKQLTEEQQLWLHDATHRGYLLP